MPFIVHGPQLAVVGHVGESGYRWAEWLRHADGENHDRRTIFAVGGAQHQVTAGVLACGLPAAAIPHANSGALGEQHKPPLHLRARWEVGRAVHDPGHDASAGLLFGEQAVPVVALVLARAAVEPRVWLGPAEHALENRPAPKHAARGVILRKHGVIDAEPREAVGQLQTAGPAADDDEWVATWRKGLRL